VYIYIYIHVSSHHYFYHIMVIYSACFMGFWGIRRAFEADMFRCHWSDQGWVRQKFFFPDWTPQDRLPDARWSLVECQMWGWNVAEKNWGFTEKRNVALDVMRSWLNVARLPCAVTSYHTSGSKLRGDKAAVVHEILSRSYCWYFVCLINVIPRTPSEILWTNLHTLKLLDVWLFFLVSLYLRHLLTGMIEPLDTCL
jgi:hypothetical protein